VGTLFCLECGSLLVEDQNHRLDPSWQYVHILAPGAQRQWRLQLPGPLWIGRADPDKGYWPHLDLTEVDGAAQGISRRHAVIDVTDQGPVLIDKNSVNGSWIENEQLAPHRPYVLPATAVVRFARLQLRIVLE